MAKEQHGTPSVLSGRGTRGRDKWVELGLLVVAFTGWIFVVMASEVVERDTLAIDERLVHVFRSPDGSGRPRGPDWLVEAGRDVTALGGPVVLSFITLAVVGWLLLRRRYAAAGTVSLAVVGGLLLCSALKVAIARERPGPGSPLVWLSTPSFPSGHAKLSAIVYLSLGVILAQIPSLHRDKLYIISLAVLLTLLVGISRVYLGVHYPTDVLGGWVAAMAWTLPWWIAVRHHQR